jgi:hypothetical protein
MEFHEMHYISVYSVKQMMTSSLSVCILCPEGIDLLYYIVRSCDDTLVTKSMIKIYKNIY